VGGVAQAWDSLQRRRVGVFRRILNLHVSPLIVGLYLDPPENAMVVCMDEKPAIQALERAQDGLNCPMVGR